MTLFEILVLGGLGTVVVFSIRIERILRAVLSIGERRSLEDVVRDHMPTLWTTPEFSHDNLVTWFDIANGRYNQDLKEKWHWATLENNLENKGESTRRRISLDEIERLKNLSSQFSHEAESSNLLTDSEVQYLLFHAWNSNLMFPDIVTPDDVVELENELSDMRQRFLKWKNR
jgi:hypothetical protein